jgi:hypothetical protein
MGPSEAPARGESCRQTANPCTLTPPRQSFTRQTAFCEITTTLACEINTLGYPKAALFALCLALLAYNAVSLIKATLRSEHGRKKINDEVSSYYLSLEIGLKVDIATCFDRIDHAALWAKRQAPPGIRRQVRAW